MDIAKGKMAPPPPPEPPKLEVKIEPTVKKEELQDESKDTETGTKPKAAKESAFSKFFRPKVGPLLSTVVTESHKLLCQGNAADYII